MENGQPTYEELVEINAAQHERINLQAQQIVLLEYELQQLKKAIIGPRSERFIPAHDGQSSLFPEDDSLDDQQSDTNVDQSDVKK